MAYYGIMRVEKRGRGAVYGLQIEANRTLKDHQCGREFDRSDIDWEKTSNNIILKRADNWQKEITRQIKSAGVKERKDSIVMLDAVYTASPDFFKNKNRDEICKYFTDCLAFHEREYGPAFNAVIHLDEQTPHLQVASVPLIEDEKGVHLSAKLVMGGRSDYRHRQDRFFTMVSQKYGLERGEINEPSKVKEHVAKRDWQISQQDDKIAKMRSVEQKTQKSIETLTSQKNALEGQIEGLTRDIMTFQQVEDVPHKKTVIGDRVTLSVEDFETLKQCASIAKNLMREIAPARKVNAKAKKIIADAEEQKAEIIRKANERANSITVAERIKSAQLRQKLEQYEKLEQQFPEQFKKMRNYNPVREYCRSVSESENRDSSKKRSKNNDFER